MTWRAGRAHRVTQPTITKPPPPSHQQEPMEVVLPGWLADLAVQHGTTVEELLAPWKVRVIR